MTSSTCTASERAVVGALIERPSIIWPHVQTSGLRSEMIEAPEVRAVFEACASLIAEAGRDTVDSFAVADELKRRSGSAPYAEICALIDDGAVTEDQAAMHARTVVAEYRRLMALALIADARSNLENARPESAGEVLAAAVEDLQRLVIPEDGAAGFAPLRPLGEPVSLPPFPLDALPERHRAHIASVADALQVPPDLPGICALGVASVACAKRFKVRVSACHTEPVNLFLCALLPPGERKSATFSAMLRPVFQAERDIREELKPVIEKAQARADFGRSRAKHLREKASKSDDPAARASLLREADEVTAAIEEPPEIPTLCTGGDTTPEALAGLCSSNGGRIAQVDPEAGALLRMFSAYQTAGSPPQIEFHLKAHAGDYFAAGRVGRVGSTIQEPALTLLLTGQPEVFRSMKDKGLLRARGLLARFLFALPVSRVGSRQTHDREPDRAAAEYFSRDVRGMLAIPSPATPEDPDLCHELCLTPGARGLWAAFAARIETAQAPDGELHELRDFASKLAGAVARIAALLTVMDGAIDPEGIGAEAMAGAIRLGDYFLAHWQGVQELSGAGRDAETARRILRWVGRHDGEDFSTADLWRGLRNGGLESPDDLTMPLADLVARGYLLQLPGIDRRGPGRSETNRYRMRPGVKCI